ncbi:MAG: hypothetical protein PHI48_06280 [Bacteroidales bacterium]|nr:hypothetical protein [Bacteroidales bacterium]
MEDQVKTIDWEQREFEVVKAVIAGLYSRGVSGKPSDNAEIAVKVAKEVIKRIKPNNVG